MPDEYVEAPEPTLIVAQKLYADGITYAAHLETRDEVDFASSRRIRLLAMMVRAQAELITSIIRFKRSVIAAIVGVSCLVSWFSAYLVFASVQVTP